MMQAIESNNALPFSIIAVVKKIVSLVRAATSAFSPMNDVPLQSYQMMHMPESAPMLMPRRVAVSTRTTASAAVSERTKSGGTSANALLCLDESHTHSEQFLDRALFAAAMDC